MSQHEQVPCFCSRTLPPDFSYLNPRQQKKPHMSVDSLMTRFEFVESTLNPDDLVDQEEEEEFANDISESILDGSVYEIDEEIIEEEEEEEESGNVVFESVLDEEIIEEEEEEEEFANDVSESGVDMSMETRTGYDIHLINEGQQQQELNQTSGRMARRTPRMSVNTNYVHYAIQVSLSTLDNTYRYEIEEEEVEEIEEEEVEDDINEFVDQDMAKYLETRAYHVVSAMDIDVNEDDPVVVDEEQEACPICLLEYQDGHTICALQCGHEFHAECIKKWFQRKKACPFCRAPVLPTTSSD